MPNWCEGTLKVRGKKDDIERWLKNALVAPNDEEIPNKQLVEFNLNGEWPKVAIKQECWIKDSYRGFIEQDHDVFTYYYDENDIIILMFDTIFAWSVKVEELAKSSKEFNVDYHFYGFEQGMQFNQLVEIHKGEVIANEFIQFDDYIWECINPTLGG